MEMSSKANLLSLKVTSPCTSSIERSPIVITHSHTSPCSVDIERSPVTSLNTRLPTCPVIVVSLSVTTLVMVREPVFFSNFTSLTIVPLLRITSPVYSATIKLPLGRLAPIAVTAPDPFTALSPQWSSIGPTR